LAVHGKPSAILIAPEDLEALEETLAIMRDAATMNRLAESDAELARGTYRIIYRIDDKNRIVTVVDVDHRRDVYRS
jgi:PHD/YefM family antitoxin component YafN of YafNO toxin-antitoxin module